MRLRKSSLITKLIILSLMVYATVTIVSLQPKIDALRAEKDELSRQVQTLQEENGDLAHDIEILGTDASVLTIARERLNLVLDGEFIIIDKSN